MFNCRSLQQLNYHIIKFSKNNFLRDSYINEK